MDSTHVIALDLGGTTIQARLVQFPSLESTTIQCETQAVRGPDHVIDRLIALARQVCADADFPITSCAGIAIAAPGPLDARRGVILRTVNLPGWENFPLTQRISKGLSLPAILINDASAACFGEFRTGAGRGVQDLALLTLGTGVGGGLVIGGRLVLGGFGHGAELGHMIVHPQGRPCSCGQRGCLEAYAGGQSLERQAVDAGLVAPNDPSKIPALVAEVERGNVEAQRIWDACCEAIALACVTLQHVANPKLILLGGGVSGAGAVLLDRVRAGLKKSTWRMAGDLPRIDGAALGTDAGVFGAAAWFLETATK